MQVGLEETGASCNKNSVFQDYGSICYSIETFQWQRNRVYLRKIATE